MHNYSRVLRNQTVSEKVTLQHLPTLITWETFSRYTDIPPSSRLCLADSTEERYGKYILLQCPKKEKKKPSNRVFFRFSCDAFGSAGTGSGEAGLILTATVYDCLDSRHPKNEVSTLRRMSMLGPGARLFNIRAVISLDN